MNLLLQRFWPLTIKTSLGYRRDIDGLRAVAVLAVVAYHTGVPGVRGGFVGVDVFFVISGFLITGLLLDDLGKRDRIDFMKFYARRVRRLLPTLVLVVLTTVLASIFFLSTELGEVGRVSRSAIATLLISANHHFLAATRDYFAVGAQRQPLLHTWSLSVEEQFYLVWPAVIAVTWAMCARFGKSRRWLAGTLIVLVIGSVACAVRLAAWRNTWAFFMAPARGWELGVGGLIALGVPMVRRVPQMLAGTAALLGLLVIAAGVHLITADGSFPIPAAVFPVFGASLVIIGNARCPDGPAGRLLSTNAMVAIGLVSYAWYLWHWPALSIVRIRDMGQSSLPRDSLISLATLALSFATFRWYEGPLRFQVGSRVSAGRVVGIGSVATLALVVIVAGAGFWTRHSVRTAAGLEMIRAKADVPADMDQCLLGLGSGDEEKAKSCLAAGLDSRIVLWGDSMVNRLSPALRQWATYRGSVVAIEQIAKAACPPLLHALPTEPSVGGWKPYEGCRSINDFAMDRLSIAGEARNSGVIMAAAWWPRATDYDLRKLGAIEPRHSFDIAARDTDQALSALESFMRSTLREVTAKGLRVLLFLQSPILLSDWDGRALDVPECLFRRTERDCSMSLSTHRQISEAVNRVLKKVAAEFAEVRVLDLTNFLCIENVCPGRINGIVAYTDYEHMSATMSRALTGQLTPYFDWLTAPREGRHGPVAGLVGN